MGKNDDDFTTLLTFCSHTGTLRFDNYGLLLLSRLHERRGLGWQGLLLYEYDDTFEWENEDGMGHYHCDMAQCEDEYIYEMRGIQRERDNNKSKDLKNDTWASLNVMQFRSSDRKVRKREKQLYLPGRRGIYIYELEVGIADSSLRVVCRGEGDNIEAGDDGEVEKLEFRKPICI